MKEPIEWVVLEEVPGELHANILKGLLEAQNIPVRLLQEGAGRAYGLSVGPLGTVQILVPEEMVDQAQTVLEEMERGAFQDSEFIETSLPEEDEQPNEAL